MDCPLCSVQSDDVLWQDETCRVILVPDPDYPGFCRVIWHAHVKEMSELPPGSQRHLLDVILAVERSLVALMQPAKINLASLGNVVPHLHWHIIPRFADDPCFPEPIWAPPQRKGFVRPQPDRARLIERIQTATPKISTS